MQIKIVKDDDFDHIGAQYFIRQIIEKSNAVIGLAGGRTTTPIHKKICEQIAYFRIDVQNIDIFNVDEYFRISKDKPATCFFRMWHQLINPLKIKASHNFCFRPDAIDPESECRRIRNEIDAHGGIDLQYLGLGTNGHIGFNNPGTMFESVAYSFNFDKSFIQQKSLVFGGEDQVPKKGMTLGIKDCMMCKKIILVANSEDKSSILRKVLHGPITTDIPASVLQLHPNVVALISETAAKEL